jgi:hypothetical protein
MRGLKGINLSILGFNVTMEGLIEINLISIDGLLLKNAQGLINNSLGLIHNALTSSAR